MAAMSFHQICMVLTIFVHCSPQICSATQNKGENALPGSDTSNGKRTVNNFNLSESGRIRRLIPYMTFNVPTQDLPIDQRYVPPPLINQQNQPSKPIDQMQPMSINAHHHSISQEKQYELQQLRQPLRRSSKSQENRVQPIRTTQRFPPLNSTQSPTFPKSAQHASPSAKEQRYQIMSPFQLRSKQPYFHFTEFTPSNSVPGNFIPIVYTTSPTKHPRHSYKAVVSLETSDSSQMELDKGVHQQYIANDYIKPSRTSAMFYGPHPHFLRYSLPDAATDQTVVVAPFLQTLNNCNTPVNINPQIAQFLSAPSTTASENGLGAFDSVQLQETTHETARPLAKSPFINYHINEYPLWSLNEGQQSSLREPTSEHPTHTIRVVTAVSPLKPVNYRATVHSYNTKNVRPEPISSKVNAKYLYGKLHLTDKRNEHFVSNNVHVDKDPIYLKEEFGQKSMTEQMKLPPYTKHERVRNKNTVQPETGSLELAELTRTHEGINAPSHVNTTSHSEKMHSLLNPNKFPDISSTTLSEILHALQGTNHLPQTLTLENIDNSIRTLISILNSLKRKQTMLDKSMQDYNLNPPPSHHHTYTMIDGKGHRQYIPTNKHPGPDTGRPGIDYPNYADIPSTSFDCSQQRYKGFFGDPETNCQVWHYCDLNGGKASFLCPNGTIFSQIALTCDWWFNVKCSTTTQLYVLNERLYKYILPFTPKFPEDYTGPLVDKYLAMKFTEMEEKIRLENNKIAQENVNASSREKVPATEHDQEDNYVDYAVIKKKKTPSALNHILSNHESGNSIVNEQSSERNLLIDDEVDNLSQSGLAGAFGITTKDMEVTTIQPSSYLHSLRYRPIIVSTTMESAYEENDGYGNIKPEDIGTVTMRTETILKLENGKN